MTNASDERFAEWMDEEMSPRERERFEAEMRVNPELRARAEEYRRTTEQVRQALRAPGPKVDVADRVFAEIATTGKPFRDRSAQSQPAPWGAVSGRSMMLSAAVAAAILVTLVLLPEWQQEPERASLAKTAGQESPAADKVARDGQLSYPTSDRAADSEILVDAGTSTLGAPPVSEGPATSFGASGGVASPKSKSNVKSESGRFYGGRAGAGARPVESAPEPAEEAGPPELGAATVYGYGGASDDAAVIEEVRKILLGRDANATMMPVLRFSQSLLAGVPELDIEESEAAPELARRRAQQQGGVEPPEVVVATPVTGSAGVLHSPTRSGATEKHRSADGGALGVNGVPWLGVFFAIPAEEFGGSVRVQSLTTDPTRVGSSEAEGGRGAGRDVPVAGGVATRGRLGQVDGGQALVIEGTPEEVEQLLAKIAKAARRKGYAMSSGEAPQEVVSLLKEAEAPKANAGKGQGPAVPAAGPASSGRGPDRAGRQSAPGAPSPAAPQVQGKGQPARVRLVLVIEGVPAPAAGKPDEKPRKR